MANKNYDIINKYPNLANVEGTFTQVIEENYLLISNTANNDNVDVEEFREIILYLLSTCKQTGWTRKAIDIVTEKTTKYEIMRFVYGAVLKGENQGSIKTNRRYG